MAIGRSRRSTDFSLNFIKTFFFFDTEFPDIFHRRKMTQNILEWSCVTVKKRADEFPLFEVSGELRRGKLTCLVGPSGAGKSVLLRALAGRIDIPSTAAVDLFEEKRSPQAEEPLTVRHSLDTAVKRRGYIGFVSVDDEPLFSATPREALEFAVSMRPREAGYTRDAKRESVLVNFYLSLLDLEGAADIPFSKLTTLNQKRFTAIATEMINERKLLLLDSPLTGLSQLGAYHFVKNMKKVVSTEANVLTGILCSLLQPTSEVLSLFDDIILMADKGQVIYQGPVSDMAAYFTKIGHVCPQHYNVSDFVLFVLHSVSAKERDFLIEKRLEFTRKISNNSSKNIPTDPDAKLCRVDFVTQLRLLTLREIRAVTRNWQSALVTRFTTSIVISLVIGLVYYQIGKQVSVNSSANAIHAYRGCVLVMCCNAMFANAQATVMALPAQRSIFLREHSTGMYSSMAYLSSKVPMEYVLSAIQVLVQLIIAYFFCALNGYFVIYWLILVAVSICAESIALMLSCVTTSPLSAFQTLPIALFPQIIFCGLIVSIKDMPSWISWLQYLCFLPYGMKLLCINEFGCASISQFTSNDIQCSNIAINGAMLVFIALLFRLIALLALQFKPVPY